MLGSVVFPQVAVDTDHHLIIAHEVTNEGSDRWLCKNPKRYSGTRNFWPCGHAGEQKTQKSVFRSALRPNQISFSHNQDPERTLSGSY
jgi:hypothetical protein